MVHSVSGADISNGRASIPIPWVNDVDDVELPNFDYQFLPKFTESLPKRMFCACRDGCSAEKGCSCVGMSTIKLSKSGHVHDAHLLSENAFDSQFFECSADCACAGTCANRLAPANDTQRHQLQIFKTPKAGFACKTMKAIRKGSFVCFLGGEVLPTDYPTIKPKDYEQIEAPDKVCFTFIDNMRQAAFFIRFDKVANESRFFNSSCCPNLRTVHLFRDWLSPDRPLVAFIAICEISAGDELSHYYGDRWILDRLCAKPKSICCCGAPFCVWPPHANRREDLFSRPKDRQLKAKTVRAELKQRDQRREAERRGTKKRRMDPEAAAVDQLEQK